MFSFRDNKYEIFLSPGALNYLLRYLKVINNFCLGALVDALQSPYMYGYF